MDIGTHNDPGANAQGSNPYPTLTPKAIASLKVLTASLPTPPPDTVAIWAQLLDVNPADITAWLGLSRPPLLPGLVHAMAAPRPPLRASSATEFERALAPASARIEKFLDAIASGALSDSGFTPELLQATKSE